MVNHIDRYKKGQASKGQWLNYWQDLADILHPKRADIAVQTEKGADRHSTLYDGAPMRARRGLAKSLDAMLKPKTSPWFNIRAELDELNDNDEAKAWFEIVEKRMWTALYAKDARFIQRTGEVDNDLVTFGTAILFIGESSRLGSLMFMCIHPKDVVIFENENGVIDTLYYKRMLTASQAEALYGNKIAQEIKTELQAGGDKTFPFLVCVYPRKTRDVYSLLPEEMPFAHEVIDMTSEKQVKVSGFHEFPFAIPRWDPADGEVFGRSPGMVALPDARTLQAMGKTLLVAGQKAVDPPMWGYDDGVIGAVRTFPGGYTVVDPTVSRTAGPPLGVLEFGKNLPLGREMQNDTRQAVEAAFFRNIFNLPIDGPQMTATEIIERKEEFIREIGPVFGQLETDYIGQIVERTFNIMQRAGGFPEPPDILSEQSVKFEFQSPIHRARRQIEAAGLARAIEMMGPMIELNPSLMDNYDMDEIARSTQDIFGLPSKWIKPLDVRDAERQQRQQLAMDQLQREQTLDASEVTKNLQA